MKAVSFAALLRLIKAVEQIAAKCRQVVTSFRYILMRRLKVEAFGERKKVSPFTWDRIGEVVDLMVAHPDYYSDSRYNKIIDLLRIIERGVWEGRPEEELKMAFDIEMVKILNDDDPPVICWQCGKEIHDEPVSTEYDGVYCSLECARDFTDD